MSGFVLGKLLNWETVHTTLVLKVLIVEGSAQGRRKGELHIMSVGTEAWKEKAQSLVRNIHSG